MKSARFRVSLERMITLTVVFRTLRHESRVTVSIQGPLVFKTNAASFENHEFLDLLEKDLGIENNQTGTFLEMLWQHPDYSQEFQVDAAKAKKLKQELDARSSLK